MKSPNSIRPIHFGWSTFSRSLQFFSNFRNWWKLKEVQFAKEKSLLSSPHPPSEWGGNFALARRLWFSLSAPWTSGDAASIPQSKSENQNCPNWVKSHIEIESKSKIRLLRTFMKNFVAIGIFWRVNISWISKHFAKDSVLKFANLFLGSYVGPLHIRDALIFPIQFLLHKHVPIVHFIGTTPPISQTMDLQACTSKISRFYAQGSKSKPLENMLIEIWNRIFRNFPRTTTNYEVCDIVEHLQCSYRRTRGLSPHALAATPKTASACNHSGRASHRLHPPCPAWSSASCKSSWFMKHFEKSICNTIVCDFWALLK